MKITSLLVEFVLLTVPSSWGPCLMVFFKEMPAGDERLQQCHVGDVARRLEVFES